AQFKTKSIFLKSGIIFQNPGTVNRLAGNFGVAYRMDLEMIKLKAIITIAFKAIGYVCSIYTNFYVFSGNLKRLRRHAVKLFSMKLNTPTFISILPYVLFAI